MIGLEALKKRLHYDPESGLWTRFNRPGRVGTVHLGYIFIHICGEKYSAHRLAWFYMTGEWPSNDIDHRDTNRSNNRWINLRLATKSQNGANRHPQRNNHSGIKGVRQMRSGRWEARIRINDKPTYLGRYDTAEEAKTAYLKVALKHFGDFAR